MFPKKQQRPTQYEFEAAVLRYTEKSYPSWWESSIAAVALQRFGAIFTFQQVPARKINMKQQDIHAIRTEQVHEGYVAGEESMAVFAKNQLARYRSLKKY